MKLYIYAGLIALVIAFLSGGYYAGYRAGHNACKASVQDAVIKHKEKEDALLLQLEKAKKERSIVYRDRIKVIEAARDSCLDTAIPDSIERLLND